ncbi:MAG TPA: TonB-dependent receptor plug domain-containing protein [Pyrinomonadaceae bacterium]
MKLTTLLFLVCASAINAFAQGVPTPTPTPSPQPIRETVTVSADQTQPIDEVSKTVNVIAGQEMRERADFALIESLRSMPGFRVQQLGGFGKTASIKARGLRNQDTAILIDGVRLRDAAAIQGDASPFLSDLTLTSVSRVEVLRGSGSSLYGTNAIGGAVDFQTPRPQEGPHGQFSYAAGGLGLHRFRGNITDGTKDGKFGFNLAAARTIYTEGIDGDDDARNTNVQSRIEWNPGSKTNVSARLFVSNAYVRLNSGPDTFGTLPPTNATIIDALPSVNFAPDSNDPLSNQKSQFYNGQIVLTQVLSPTATLRAYYSGLQTSRRSNNSGFSISVFDGTIQIANATLNWSPNRFHDVKGGYEYEYEKYGNDGITPDTSGDFFARAYQSSHTLFLQDVVSLDDGRLQLAGGFRAQSFSLDDPRFSLTNAPYSTLSLEDPPTAYTFDGAASYFFRSSGTKLRVHVGNGYRVPSLYERFGTFFSTFFGPEFVALGDPNLKPEKSIAIDGGIEQYFAKEKVKLTAVYFYTELLDTISYGNVVPDIGSTVRPFGGYENQDGGISRGAEFSGSIKATTSTDIFASYTFTNSDNLGTRVAGSGVVETLGVPKHQFTLTATQRVERFWVNADVLVASDYLAPVFSNSTFTTYLYRFGGNRRVDLTAGYTFPINKDRLSLRVFGTIENLFDHEYFENGFRTVPRNGRIGVSFGF